MDMRDRDMDGTPDRLERQGGTSDPDDKGNLGARLVGEGVGGTGGMVAGAAIGSLLGPIGTLVGALAGTVGGWWAGKEVADAATSHTDADDEYYRTHYQSRAGAGATRSYDDVRPAYALGHIAARNPDYQGRSFDEVEPDLRRGWSDDLRTQHGEWDDVRGYASEGYTRGRGTMGGATTGTSTGASGGFADRTADRARSLGDRAVDAVDDVKDRVDGNPASRPGPDATDRRF